MVLATEAARVACNECGRIVDVVEGRVIIACSYVLRSAFLKPIFVFLKKKISGDVGA